MFDMMLENFCCCCILVFIVDEFVECLQFVFDQGYMVIMGQFFDGLFEWVYLDNVWVFVVNGRDDENVVVIFEVWYFGFEGDLIMFVVDLFYVGFVMIVGVLVVFILYYVFGEVLVQVVVFWVIVVMVDVGCFDVDVLVCQIWLFVDSEFVGCMLGEVDVGGCMGVIVFGQWVKGILEYFVGFDLKM